MHTHKKQKESWMKYTVLKEGSTEIMERDESLIINVKLACFLLFVDG